MKFAKAHGLGNDFIMVDQRDAPPRDAAGPWARRLCDRHTGIGGDGLLSYAVEQGRLRLQLYNADGSDGDLSGNGLRCLAAYAVSRGWLPPRHVVETPPGPRHASVERLDTGVYRVEADLGEPILDSARIPVALEPPAPRVVGHDLRVDGETVTVTASSMGNPHCTLLLDAPADHALMARLGPALERHAFFPRRTNVEFACPTSREEITVRFWERGVGPTRASGTGAAAAAVASILAGRVERRVRVRCEGGILDVDWAEGGSLRQTGEVELLFEGEWLR